MAGRHVRDRNHRLEAGGSASRELYHRGTCLPGGAWLLGEEYVDRRAPGDSSTHLHSDRCSTGGVVFPQ